MPPVSGGPPRLESNAPPGLFFGGVSRIHQLENRSRVCQARMGRVVAWFGLGLVWALLGFGFAGFELEQQGSQTDQAEGRERPGLLLAEVAPRVRLRLD
jgi:hypothetical protein